jgi:hypothetical protein
MESEWSDTWAVRKDARRYCKLYQCSFFLRSLSSQKLHFEGCVPRSIDAVLRKIFNLGTFSSSIELDRVFYNERNNAVYVFVSY